MPRTFHHSNQAEFRDDHWTPLGLMVWDGSDLRYYAVPGEEAHAADMTGRWEGCLRAHNGSLEGWLDYFLERGGGYLRSFSSPESLEADGFDDVARRIGQRYGRAYVIPPAPQAVEPIAPDLLRAFLLTFRAGARLQFEGPDGWTARDVASYLALEPALPHREPAAILAYAGHPLEVPPFLPDTRFFANALDRDGDAWILTGRSLMEGCPATRLRVLPAEGELLQALRRERHVIDDVVWRHVTDEVLRMTDVRWA